ncbi:hypothetical protein ACKWTF_013518 [Chironomus riparius]
MEALLKGKQSFKIYLKKLFNKSPKSTLIEFDDFLGSEKMINYFGFYNLPRDTPLSKNKIRKVFYTSTMILSVVFLSLNLFSIGYGISTGGSFLILTENVGVVCIEGLILMKGFTVMYWYRERFMEIVVKLKKHFPNNSWDHHVFLVPQHLRKLIKASHWSS